jgi:hypothetical protein
MTAAPISLAHALPVVLDAFASVRGQDRARLAGALRALLEDDCAEYRSYLAELLQPRYASAPSATERSSGPDAAAASRPLKGARPCLQVLKGGAR